MKFLYLQDFHLSGKAPCNRIDNFYQSLLLKLEEILLIAKKEKVEFIIDGGDFFNSELVANTIVDEVLDRIENAKIKWKMLFGNHCMTGHSIENSKATSLQHMFNRSKYVEHLTTLEFKDCIITGIDYEHNIEEKIKEEGLMCPKETKFKIAIIHALISPKPMMPQILHIAMKDIKTNYNLIMCAHYHSQYGIIEQNGAKYVNIGACGRSGVDEAKIMPTIALIDTSTQEIKLIPLKSAKIGSEVFDLSKIQKNKVFEADIDNFIKSLDSTKFKALDIKGLVEFLAKENNVEKEVKEEVIKRIGGFEND